MLTKTINISGDKKPLIEVQYIICASLFILI